MRCDACRYWEAPDADEWEPVRARMGRCKRTPHTEDMSEWSSDFDRRVIVAEYADRTAAAFDASGYSAGLLTAPEHFCAMFAATPTTGADHDR